MNRSIAVSRQQGLSLTGFIFVAAVVGVLVVLGMKIVPTVVEYSAIKKAIVAARDSGSSVREIQDLFDKQSSATYIESVSGRDLEITRTDSGFEVSVAYQKKIELIGPASLVLDYVASTGRSAP